MTPGIEFDGINRLLHREDIASTEAGGVDVHAVESLETPAAVRARIVAFSAQEGWLCFTDRVEAFSKQQSLPDLDGSVVLYGELVSGRRSLHIRQNGSEWTAREIVRSEATDCAVVFERFVPTRETTRAFAHVTYETFWRVDKSAGDELRPYVSRFAGFDAFDAQRGAE